MKLQCLFAGLLVAAAAAAPPAPVRVEPGQSGLSAERLRRISAGMQRYVDRKETAGFVMLVARRGQVAYVDAIGHQDKEAGTPMKVDTIFRLASMTKPIASVAAMMLVEEGRMQLGDPISKFLPEFKNPKVRVANRVGEREEPTRLEPARREITVRDLLTHQSGLAVADGINAAELAKVGRPAGDTIAAYSKRLAAAPLDFHPGTAWSYGPSVDIVGRLVEVVSGVSFDRFLQQRIFDPLGMKDTHFYVPDAKLARVAKVYEPAEGSGIRPAGGGAAGRGSQTFFSGSGGLFSTADDYYKFCQMLLNGGRAGTAHLLSRKTLELMTANHIGNHPLWPRLSGNRFGLGFRVLSNLAEAGHLGSVGSYGWGGAFGTYFWVDPKEEMTGIMMVQIRPFTQLNIRLDFQNLATQAIE